MATTWTAGGCGGPSRKCEPSHLYGVGRPRRTKAKPGGSSWKCFSSGTRGEDRKRVRFDRLLRLTGRLMVTNEEKQRLANDPAKNWKLWGPYLSERQWGTVREDYSPHGNAWEYLPHDHARSRAYRWGEDGIAGISDDHQRLCLSLALWNGKDPILKERIFGLTNSEGNHGEDAKELYYYLDATPTHSYLKMLYKYPQREFPYAQLVEENARRRGDSSQREFELLETGIFDDDRYFDVFVEYAKAGPEDILMRVTVHNRGPEEVTIHLLPQLWFRNAWSWKPDSKKPQLSLAKSGMVSAKHAEFGDYTLSCDGKPEMLFCENETNARRLYGKTDAIGFFKDGFHEYVVHGDQSAVSPGHTGTKAGALYKLAMPAGGSTTARLRLVAADVRRRTPDGNGDSASSPRRLHPFADFDAIFAARLREADEFYADLQADNPDADARNVQRQAVP